MWYCVDWWNAWWLESHSRIHIKVVCLLWLQLISLLMNERAPLLITKGLFGIHQSLALLPCFSLPVKHGIHSLVFLQVASEHHNIAMLWCHMLTDFKTWLLFFEVINVCLELYISRHWLLCWMSVQINMCLYLCVMGSTVAVCHNSLTLQKFLQRNMKL